MTNAELIRAKLAEMRALHEKATPGPWTANTNCAPFEGNPTPNHVIHRYVDGAGCRITEIVATLNSQVIPNADNAKLTAALRNAAPGLLMLDKVLDVIEHSGLRDVFSTKQERQLDELLAELARALGCGE